jgi:hypothetical protein
LDLDYDVEICSAWQLVLNAHLEMMIPDRVFCFYEIPKMPTRGRMKADLMPGSQATLEAFS